MSKLACTALFKCDICGHETTNEHPDYMPKGWSKMKLILQQGHSTELNFHACGKCSVNNSKNYDDWSIRIAKTYERIFKNMRVRS